LTAQPFSFSASTQPHSSLIPVVAIKVSGQTPANNTQAPTSTQNLLLSSSNTTSLNNFSNFDSPVPSRSQSQSHSRRGSQPSLVATGCHSTQQQASQSNSFKTLPNHSIFPPDPQQCPIIIFKSFHRSKQLSMVAQSLNPDLETPVTGNNSIAVVTTATATAALVPSPVSIATLAVPITAHFIIHTSCSRQAKITATINSPYIDFPSQPPSTIWQYPVISCTPTTSARSESKSNDEQQYEHEHAPTTHDEQHDDEPCPAIHLTFQC
jgi:hypothetical protein